MKSKQGRKKRLGVPRRRMVRIDEDLVEVFDRYSDQEWSAIANRALRTIFPASQASNMQAIIIRPDAIQTETVCRIVLNGQSVQINFPEKRDDFRGIVRRFLYTWKGLWEREFSTDVDIVDRAAEIGNELLCEGFCIQVAHTQVQDRILARSFVPEAFKRILCSGSQEYNGWFVFDYPKGEEWYDEIMKLTAARYSNGGIYVPPEQFEEVEDFAEINGFELSDRAQEAVKQARQMRDSAIIIQPRRKTKKSKNEACSSQSSIVPAHLRDDAED